MSRTSQNFSAADRPGIAGSQRAEKKAPFRRIRGPLDTLKCWHQRNRQRTALAEPDDRMLRDIGLIREDVAREVRKSFWQK